MSRRRQVVLGGAGTRLRVLMQHILELDSKGCAICNTIGYATLLFVCSLDLFGLQTRSMTNFRALFTSPAGAAAPNKHDILVLGCLSGCDKSIQLTYSLG